MAERHNWTMEEELYCCRRYVEQYVLNKSNTDCATFLNQLDKELVNISKGSIRMKIQNTKQILAEKNIEDFLDISPLKKYSKRNKKAVEAVLLELGIEKL